MIVPIDKSKWSESSKNSYSYCSSIENYSDIYYTCLKCGENSVFSAEDQKYVFEVKKSYVWQRRTLCQRCYKEFKELKAAIKKFEKLWANESDSSKRLAPYIQDWINALNQVPQYRKPSNEAMIKHLSKYVDKNA